MTLKHGNGQATDQLIDSSSTINRPAECYSPGVSDKQLAQGYRSFLQTQCEQRSTAPEVVEQIKVLSNALTTPLSNLGESRSALELVNRMLETIGSLQTMQGKIAAGTPVYTLGSDLVLNLQSLNQFASHALVEGPSKGKLDEATNCLVAAMQGQTTEASTGALARTITCLDHVCIEMASPMLRNAFAIKDLLTPWVDQPQLSRAASTMKAAIQHVEDLAKNPLDSSRASLIAAVTDVQQKLAATITLQQDRGADIQASEVSNLESYIEELTGMRPTFERWMRNFADFRNLVTIQSAPDEEIKSHHAREQLEKVTRLLEERVDQLSPTELVQYAGLLRNREGGVSIPESLVIEEAVKATCGLSEHQMTLINQIENLVDQKGERIALERKHNTMEGHAAELRRLSSMARVAGENKTTLVDSVREYYRPTPTEIQELFVSTLAAGGIIIPKEPVIKGSLETIAQELPRVEQMSADLDRDMASTFKLAVESARLCGASEQDATELTRLKDTITLFFKAGYYGARWGKNEHQRALSQLDRVGRSLKDVGVAPALRAVPEPHADRVIQTTGREITPAPLALESDGVVESRSDAAVSVAVIEPEATSSTQGQTTENNPRAAEIDIYAEMLPIDATSFGLQDSELLDSALDPERTYQTIFNVTKKLGEALESSCALGSADKGERIVCRIVDTNLAALIKLTDQQVEAWATEVSATLSMLRFAENFTADRRMVEALSNHASKELDSMLEGILRVSSDLPFEKQVERLALYNRNLSEITSLLWSEVNECDDAATRMALLQRRLGKDLYSRLLPAGIGALAAELRSREAQSQGERANEGNAARQNKGDMDRQIDEIANAFHTSGIPLFANKGPEFFRMLAYAFAYGWGKQPSQSSQGVGLVAFYENMSRGARGFSRREIDGLVNDCKKANLFIVDRGARAGKVGVKLNRQTGSREVESFIHQVLELRRTGSPIAS